VSTSGDLKSQHLGGMYCPYLQGPVGPRRVACAPVSSNRCDVLPMLHVIQWGMLEQTYFVLEPRSL
jgi:hypothetical protein